MRELVLAAALVGCSSAWAQNVTNVDRPVSRATVMFSNGEYRSCGLRFVGIALSSVQPIYPAYGWDFNITIGSVGSKDQFAAVLKTEVSKVDSPEALRTAPLVKVADTWLQAEGKRAARPLKSGIPGENGLSSMTLYPLGDWTDILLGAVRGDGQPLLLGVRLDGEKATRVYRFTPDVQAEDGKAFAGCMLAMIDQLQQKPGSR